MILHFDAKDFPEAFAPDGRETLEALLEAARSLEAERAVRLTWPKGPEQFLPKEVRLGPEELERAYALATGFEPLSVGLSKMSAHLSGMPADLPPWTKRWIDEVQEKLSGADTRPLGVAGRDRFKREWRDIRDAVTAAVRLAAGERGLERVVSERIFGDSKRLSAIRSRVVGLLLSADPSWDGVEAADHATVLSSYGVQRKPALIPAAGRGALQVNGRTIHLEDFSPAAYLPEAWTPALVEALRRRPPRRILTVENEYPFLSYVDAGLPEDELAVYVAGFPTPALVDALRQIREATGAELFHWGDADTGGLRIWWLLRNRVGPVRLFRTTAAWLRQEAAAGRKLRNEERAALHRLRAQIEGSDHAGAPDVEEALALLRALLETNRKLEQEHHT